MHEHTYVITDGNKKYCTCGQYEEINPVAQEQTGPTPEQQDRLVEALEEAPEPQGQVKDGLIEDPVEVTWQDLYRKHDTNGSNVETRIAFIEQLLGEQQQQIVNRILDNLFKE